MKPLSEIATESLPILERLKVKPLDAPMDIVLWLGAVSTDLEAHGKKDLANKITVLVLAVAPIPDHETRPEKLDVFASYLIGEVERELKGFLE